MFFVERNDAFKTLTSNDESTFVKIQLLIYIFQTIQYVLFFSNTKLGL